MTDDFDESFLGEELPEITDGISPVRREPPAPQSKGTPFPQEAVPSGMAHVGRLGDVVDFSTNQYDPEHYLAKGVDMLGFNGDAVRNFGAQRKEIGHEIAYQALDGVTLGSLPYIAAGLETVYEAVVPSSWSDGGGWTGNIKKHMDYRRKLYEQIEGRNDLGERVADAAHLVGTFAGAGKLSAVNGAAKNVVRALAARTSAEALKRVGYASSAELASMLALRAAQEGADTSSDFDYNRVFNKWSMAIDAAGPAFPVLLGKLYQLWGPEKINKILPEMLERFNTGRGKLATWLQAHLGGPKDFFKNTLDDAMRETVQRVQRQLDAEVRSAAQDIPRDADQAFTSSNGVNSAFSDMGQEVQGVVRGAGGKTDTAMLRQGEDLTVPYGTVNVKQTVGEGYSGAIEALKGVDVEIPTQLLQQDKSIALNARKVVNNPNTPTTSAQLQMAHRLEGLQGIRDQGEKVRRALDRNAQNERILSRIEAITGTPSASRVKARVKARRDELSKERSALEKQVEQPSSLNGEEAYELYRQLRKEVRPGEAGPKATLLRHLQEQLEPTLNSAGINLNELDKLYSQASTVTGNMERMAKSASDTGSTQAARTFSKRLIEKGTETFETYSLANPQWTRKTARKAVALKFRELTEKTVQGTGNVNDFVSAFEKTFGSGKDAALREVLVRAYGQSTVRQLERTLAEVRKVRPALEDAHKALGGGGAIKTVISGPAIAMTATARALGGATIMSTEVLAAQTAALLGSRGFILAALRRPGRAAQLTRVLGRAARRHFRTPAERQRATRAVLSLSKLVSQYDSQPDYSPAPAKTERSLEDIMGDMKPLPPL